MFRIYIYIYLYFLSLQRTKKNQNQSINNCKYKKSTALYFVLSTHFCTFFFFVCARMQQIDSIAPAAHPFCIHFYIFDTSSFAQFNVFVRRNRFQNLFLSQSFLILDSEPFLIDQSSLINFFGLFTSIKRTANFFLALYIRTNHTVIFIVNYYHQSRQTTI